MGATALKFNSKGMTNSIRVQGGDGVPPNVLGVFSNDSAGTSVSPNQVRCFVDQGILSLGAMQVFLDDDALKKVHVFLTAQFKQRGIYWGC
jgi:hypothetical protein